jgi:dTDP-4-amino-4,6-dideoxygalactose transaminase
VTAAVQVPFAAPLIGPEEIDAVTAVLRSGWIGTGSVAEETERRFADYLGTEHALLLNSGTAALHLAMLSLGIGAGDEVIVPTVTFTATAASVMHAGATPVLVDVEPSTLLIDVDRVRAALTGRTRAVVAVHFAGRLADVRALRRLCDEHGLFLIEDSAHALPAERDGAGPGTVADATAFSFFVTKPLTSAEGGLLTTPHAERAAAARTLSAHGIDRDAYARHRFGGRSPHYDVVAPGLKYNMPDVAAALVRTQLDRCDWMWERRRVIAEAYLKGLSSLPGLELPPADSATDKSSWYLFVVQLPPGSDRDALAAELHRRGIGTSVHFRPLHQFTAYAGLPSAAGAFPVAEAAFPRLLSLPIFPAMSDDDVAAVISTLAAVLEGAA